MALLELDDVVEVAIRAEFDQTEDIVSVYQFQAGIGFFGTIDDLLDEVVELVESIVTLVKVFAGTLTVWRQFRYRNLTQQGPSYNAQMPDDVLGQIAGDSLPAGVAMLHVFRTGQRRVTLKKYHGVGTESMIESAGQWYPGAATGAAAYAAHMLDDISTTTITWRYGHWHEDTATFVVPQAMYMSYEPAYQRRRTRGRGS